LASVYGKTIEAGDDLRFTDNDGKTTLSYDIAKYSSAGQNALIWIKVPSIGANTTKTIYMYYGNSSAPPGTTLSTFSLPSDVSSSNLKVWLKADAITGHTDNDLIDTWNDSSGNSNNATRAVVAGRHLKQILSINCLRSDLMGLITI